MGCNKNRLVIKIKSGEDKGVEFLLKNKTGDLDDKGNPIYNNMDLTNFTIEVDIKEYPYYSVKPLIKKILTTKMSGDVGWIEEQILNNKGRFVIMFTLEDQLILKPEKEYYLILTLVSGQERTIISGEAEKTGILYICK